MSQYYEINENDTGDYSLLNNTNTAKKSSVKIQKNTKDTNKKSQKVNTFPMAWTCYKKDGKFICPMRGDKP